MATKAYEAALRGGRHANFLRDYRRLPDHLIEKAIRSLEAQLVQHRAWIKDPFVKLSRSADPQRIRDLVEKKWPKDINRHQEQIEILRGIIQERRK